MPSATHLPTAPMPAHLNHPLLHGLNPEQLRAVTLPDEHALRPPDPTKP